MATGIGNGCLIRARFIGAVIKVPSGPLSFEKQEVCQFSENPENNEISTC
ncbi:hypothetical protein ACXHMN_01630 [Rhizobium sp. LEGMi12c]